jgi:hypothetical protein
MRKTAGEKYGTRWVILVKLVHMGSAPPAAENPPDPAFAQLSAYTRPETVRKYRPKSPSTVPSENGRGDETVPN